MRQGYCDRTDTRETFYCPPEQSNSGWSKCVEDALDCLFKPYVEGAWKPPSQECVTFYPRGYNGNIKSFCIANCYPARVGIYEYVKGKAMWANNTSPNTRFQPHKYGLTVLTDADTAAGGGTGIFFVDGSTNDELVSKSKAIVYGLIF